MPVNMIHNRRSLVREVFYVINKGCKTETYNQHRNQQVLLGDLSVGEDIVEHIGHVAFVFLTQCEHTLVIMSCSQTNM